MMLPRWLSSMKSGAAVKGSDGTDDACLCFASRGVVAMATMLSKMDSGSFALPPLRLEELGDDDSAASPRLPFERRNSCRAAMSSSVVALLLNSASSSSAVSSAPMARSHSRTIAPDNERLLLAIYNDDERLLAIYNATTQISALRQELSEEKRCHCSI